MGVRVREKPIVRECTGPLGQLFPIILLWIRCKGSPSPQANSRIRLKPENTILMNVYLYRKLNIRQSTTYPLISTIYIDISADRI